MNQPFNFRPPASVSASWIGQSASPQPTTKRPNIVLILADDMGFSDMGMFGSEIKTPNLDTLAMNGTRFTNFYTHASCSPTRATILPGHDTHINGLGAMDDRPQPNGQRRL